MTVLLWKSPSELAVKAVAASFVVALVTGLVIVPTLVSVAWTSALENASDVDKLATWLNIVVAILAETIVVNPVIADDHHHLMTEETTHILVADPDRHLHTTEDQAMEPPDLHQITTVEVDPEHLQDMDDPVVRSTITAAVVLEVRADTAAHDRLTIWLENPRAEEVHMAEAEIIR